MKHRETVLLKLEQVEGKLKTLSMMVKMGQPIEEFLKVLGESEELIQETKDYVNREQVPVN